MKYKFTVKKSCTDKTCQDCADNIIGKIKTLLGDNISGVNYHISINHVENKHAIWLFFYDKSGEHQSENTITKEIIKQKSDKIKKFSGTIPTESELKKAIK